MTLTSKSQHEADIEREKKLESDYWQECRNCEELVSDTEAVRLAGHWYCHKDCREEHFLELLYKVRSLEEKE